MRQLLSVMAIAALSCGAAYANCGDKECGDGGGCDKKAQAECAKKNKKAKKEAAKQATEKAAAPEATEKATQ